jgi:hypothetical protein
MIRVALFESKSVVGRLIQWQTRGGAPVLLPGRSQPVKRSYTHAGLVVQVGSGEAFLYEAVEGTGVRVMPVQERRLQAGEVCDLYAVEGLEQTIPGSLLGFLTLQLGKPYDYRMVVRFVPLLFDLLPWVNERRQRATRRSAGRWFCSELVFAALEKAKVSLFARTLPWQVSPDFLSRSPLLRPVGGLNQRQRSATGGATKER